MSVPRRPNAPRRGEQHHAARLTEEKVREMRELHTRGLCVGCIALLHDARYTTAWDAVNYRTWKHVAGGDEQ